MRKLAILAVRLYPYDFRAAFAEEMILILEQRPVGLRELLANLLQIACEWLAKLTADKTARGRALPDIRMMRPAGVSLEDWFVPRRPPCSSDTSASH